MCLAVSGDLRIEKGQVVEQRTAAQAGPSGQGSSPIENERGPQGRTQGCTPGTQRKRPAVCRNASVKRKAPWVDDESGDEVGEERVFKVCTSQSALIHRYSFVVRFTAGQAPPHMIHHCFQDSCALLLSDFGATLIPFIRTTLVSCRRASFASHVCI